ncbi:DNA translocase FtsK [Lederbergia graminis]|uniref:DNA translocase FtsK n=1 Tax=Lederbergia graminis TaxID=735518 RepID=A0ABW0LGJ1_9BACI
MSWFRKVFSKFLDSEHEESQTSYENKQLQNNNHIPKMNTKMTYHYPKGNFRFPLIEDEPKRERQSIQQKPDNQRNTNRSASYNRQPNRYSSPPQVDDGERLPKTLGKEYPESVFQKKDRRPTSNKIESKSRQPFRPSTVPSPIYGFNDPRKAKPFSVDENPLSQQMAESETEQENNLDTHEVVHIPEASTVPEHVHQDETEKEVQYESSEEFVTEEKNEPVINEMELSSNQDDVMKEESKESNPTNLTDMKQKKPRRNMPFNVLMLKQDRKSFQERQKSRQETNEEVSQNVQQGSQQLQQAYKEAINTEVAASTDVTDKTLESYVFPPIQLLHPPVAKAENKQWIAEQTELLDETLQNFNVNAYVVNVSQGPSVTRFEVHPERGVKVNKITNLSDDIKLSLAAKDIRMEAPIPGKRTIGIELPNHESRPVQISEIINDETFLSSESPLTAALGLDISGTPVVTDLKKMPHGLIAGATGSGKSVCINSILVSLLYKAKPEDLKLLLIDPKMVELAPYNHIPHLVSPVITDVKAATAALKWAVDEMERRYELFAHASVRDINRYNIVATENGQHHEKLPFIVIVIDELADLMMMAPHDVEDSICRIAQKARACGIHLIIATQRPSVDVITGLIKANVPTRIAFSVSSQVDSRTIIDISGAEKLLGRGDMLFLESGSSKPVRLQGTFVSDEEIDRVIDFVRNQGEPNYLFEQEELLKKAQIQEDEDELLMDACDFVVNQGSASTSLLQRNFRIGYNRAARLMEMLETQGIISEPKGSKPRDVLINHNELEKLKETL